jgi:PAS domain S-box-containing protein
MSGKRPLSPRANREFAALRSRLADAEAALRAVRNGEVDAVVVSSSRGSRVFTLAGAEHAYRVLIETMNEGALALTADKMILYANRRFAGMVKSPLEQVIGSSMGRFLSAEDRALLKAHLRRTSESGAKFQVMLVAGDGSRMPVQISLRPMEGSSPGQRTIGVVVTDISATRRSEELLRALSKRVVQVQEAERGRVAFELHDNITQLVCAVLFRSQALADHLSPRDGTSKKEAMKLRAMLGKTAREVERISHNLGPTVLDNLGLATALGEAGTKFAERTGVSVKVACVKLTARMPADTELALYRILQEALRNVEKHASARHVTVSLSKIGGFVRLAIGDDGIGFEPDLYTARGRKKRGLGLLSMSERAGYVGAAFKITSKRRSGTEIEILVPMTAPVRATAV